MKVLKSNRNSNVYKLFEDRIEITSDDGNYTIPLPKDCNSDIICFYDLFYDSDYKKLRVIAARRKGYDIQYVIDEESLTLKEKAFFK